jgi:deoxyribonuclease-4
MGKSAMLGSLDDTIRMSQEVAQVKPCLDFAHLHARTGDGSMNTRDEWLKMLEQYAEELGEQELKNLHIHLSGIEYTEKGEKNHLPVEESDFDMQALFSALAELDCCGRILCESPTLEDDALLMKSEWEAFLQKAGS